MPEPDHRRVATQPRPQRGPWTLAGGPDPDYDHVERNGIRAMLTDPSLAGSFRARFPDDQEADYDEMVRALGYVWDCPQDGAANVTGFRCAGCGRTRAAARI